MKTKTIRILAALAAALVTGISASALPPLPESTAQSTCGFFEETRITDEDAAALAEHLSRDLAGGQTDIDRLDNGAYSRRYGCTYFYDQLSSGQQSLYDSLVEAAEKAAASTADFTPDARYGNKVVYGVIEYSLPTEEMREAFSAFYTDNPQYFFIRQACLFSDSLLIPQMEPCFAEYSVRRSYADGIAKTAGEWLPKINQKKTFLEKEMLIKDLLCDRIEYARTDRDQSVAGALVDGKCVCNGYSMAFSYFANAAGMDTIMALGQQHSWNMIRLYGDWYNVDMTAVDGGLELFNVSTEAVQSADDSSDPHRIAAEYYVNRTLPVCEKSDPAVPDSSVDTLSVTLRGDSALLNWEKSELASQYRVYQRENGKFKLLGTTSGTEYTASGLTRGQRYGFLILGYNGYEWYPYSENEIVYAAVPLIDKPQISVVPGDDSAVVRWDSVEGADEYAVYYHLDGRYFAAGTTAGTSKIVYGLANGTEYGFLVRARKGTVWSSFSDSDLVHEVPRVRKPAFTVTPGDGSAVVSWEAITGAEKYAVYYYLDGRYFAAGDSGGAPVTVSGLNNGTEYGFLVRAYIGTRWSRFTVDDNVYAVPQP